MRLYLQRDLLDQVSLVGVIKGNALLRGPIHNQLPQHGALLSDLFGQAAGVNAWNKGKDTITINYLFQFIFEMICSVKRSLLCTDYILISYLKMWNKPFKWT